MKEQLVKKPESNNGQQLTTLLPTGLPTWLVPNGGTPYFTSIPMTTDDGFALAVQAATKKDHMLINMKGEIIKVRAWMMSPYDGEDEETGEQVKGAVRIGLVLDNNKIATTYSYGVRQSLILATGRYGCTLWSPPVEFLVDTTPGAKPGWEKIVLIPHFNTVKEKAK